MNSLRKLVWLSFLVVGILLGSIVLLGLYQYRLVDDYNEVINRNERALFQFMTIRESIIESLISNDWQRFELIVSDIQKLNSEIARLKENKLVSAELQLALVDRVDLPGLTILLRQVAYSDHDAGRAKKLQEQLRSISDYLIQFDRIIVGQARERIVNFQMVVIGALGIIISLASISLVLLYRNTINPLLALSRQLQQADGINREEPITLPPPVVDEIALLVQDIQRLAVQGDQGAANAHKAESEQKIRSLLSDAVNETTNRLNGIINYAQLLSDSAENEQLTEEQLRMLEKIIETSGEIATQWQKLK